MSASSNLDALGPPELKVAGLSVWVHDRPYAGSEEPYDADWLTITAHCDDGGASVFVRGAFVTSSALERFAEGCDRLHSNLAGRAWLASDEPNLTVTLEATDSVGHLLAIVEIAPDHLSQEHRFEFQIDQTWLLDIARHCRAILGRYPKPHHSQGRSNKPPAADERGGHEGMEWLWFVSAARG